MPMKRRKLVFCLSVSGLDVIINFLTRLPDINSGPKNPRSNPDQLNCLRQRNRTSSDTWTARNVGAIWKVKFPSSLLLYKLNVRKCIFLLERNNERKFKCHLSSLFFVPNSLARRCKLVAHCFDSFQNLGFVVVLRNILARFFRYAGLVEFIFLFLVPSLRKVHPLLSLLCSMLFLSSSHRYALVHVLFRWVFLLCASLFFFFVFAECLLVALFCTRTLLTILFLLFRFILLLSFLCCELRS